MKAFLLLIFSAVQFYCYSQQTHFDNIDSALKQPHNVRSLRLTNNKTTVNLLPKEFLKFTELNSLYIEWRQVVDYTQVFNILSQLPNLKRLELEYYADSILPPSIGQLKQLQHLKIKELKLNMLPSEIAGMTSLEELDIASDGWHKPLKIPKEIRELYKLKKLSLVRCFIKNLPDEIYELNSLEELSLADNKLNVLSDNIGKLTSLVKLNVSYNDLTNLPSNMAQLLSLKYLTLSGNELSKLPLYVYNFKDLEILNLDWCGLSEIDSTICDLHYLKGLNLSNNINIKALPESIGRLQNLEYLYIECTQIKRLPSPLLKNQNIKNISVSPNVIKNKKRLERQYSDKIYISHSCDEIEELTVDFEKKYGKIHAWMHRFEDDTVQLHYKFSYNEPNSVDEEYTRYVVVKFAGNEFRKGQIINIPDSAVIIFASSLSMAHWGDYYSGIQGQLTFIKIKKNTIRVQMNLKQKYSDYEREVINNKILTFHKKNRKPIGYNVMSLR